MTEVAKSNLTPEARRKDAMRRHSGLQTRIREKTGPGSRFFNVTKRVVTGAWEDGFIHAGNLAYVTLLALFPFFIAVGAIFSVIGEQEQLDGSIDNILLALPPRVAEVLAPVAHDVVALRQGWLLWIGGLFGVWSAASLIETIRDILHRAYGTQPTRTFWRYRLTSTGLILAAVLIMLISLSGQVLIASIEEVLVTLLPGIDAPRFSLAMSHLVTGLGLYGSIYTLFYALTPSAYQKPIYPRWPGALLVTVWWVVVAAALPRVLSTFFRYDLTYGSLAGVMIALFFFWLVGLGMVVGAELNAALTESPEERAMNRAGAPAEAGTGELQEEYE
ncbi:membrane protein [Novosphingobium fluoreni]|uniref:Membrane protein n=1 Tax=Novosphingobium fluoreni TaxID=1391222 RepID=A0A7W6BYW7_9SPHN|nr:YihY/virulence factor BrkB family protein [Novosphingobium fluoreni]MBB3938990.1 membrane protein [Novosphingobium fluoreni]